ncbi:hypothetical protein Poli38472_004071 [Pythium oligandrum]|uniref:Carboxypeptidase n=1 Tax=Pythium oligandrum TaxID=41045 RepID=A0A8K1CME3_PYTOL|nr:hypothetical protein Poli38472_004071 [Pythium oligandrum]|eukprot:TMW66306.1 hypothetical protein Poli38472_004071 [Pythium oligandrum]
MRRRSSSSGLPSDEMLAAPSPSIYKGGKSVSDGLLSPYLVGDERHTQIVVEQRQTRRFFLLSGIGVAVLLVSIGVLVYFILHIEAKSSSASFTSSSTFNPNEESLCDDVQQDAGYIALPHKKNAYAFYWFFASRREPSQDPLIVWIDGGPGCSSLWSMLAENGPCSVEKDLSTTSNPFSWNKEANVLWLDQPTFTGYSVGTKEDYDDETDDVSVNIHAFLVGFFERHPELRRNALFLAGEGYAGHYLLAATLYIQTQNTRVDSSLQIQVKGLALGNPLIVPSVQHDHTLDMLDNSYNISLASNEEARAAQIRLSTCLDLIQECKSSVGACVDATIYCQKHVGGVLRTAGRNPFDIRKECNQTAAADCYDSSAITSFLNSERVQTYLGIQTAVTPTWKHCNLQVAMDFAYSGDFMRDYDSYMTQLLTNTDVRVLVYAGDADIVCNWSGNYAWTKSLDWPHHDEYNAASEVTFRTLDGKEAGMVRTYANQLTFMRVFESGYRVPMDQPQVALEMMTRFMNSQSIAG